MFWPQIRITVRRPALFTALLITLAATVAQAQWVPTRVFGVREGLDLVKVVS